MDSSQHPTTNLSQGQTANTTLAAPNALAQSRPAALALSTIRGLQQFVRSEPLRVGAGPLVPLPGHLLCLPASSPLTIPLKDQKEDIEYVFSLFFGLNRLQPWDTFELCGRLSSEGMASDDLDVMPRPTVVITTEITQANQAALERVVKLCIWELWYMRELFDVAVEVLHPRGMNGVTIGMNKRAVLNGWRHAADVEENGQGRRDRQVPRRAVL